MDYPPVTVLINNFFFYNMSYFNIMLKLLDVLFHLYLIYDCYNDLYIINLYLFYDCFGNKEQTNKQHTRNAIVYNCIIIDMQYTVA